MKGKGKIKMLNPIEYWEQNPDIREHQLKGDKAFKFIHQMYKWEDEGDQVSDGKYGIEQWIVFKHEDKFYKIDYHDAGGYKSDSDIAIYDRPTEVKKSTKTKIVEYWREV